MLYAWLSLAAALVAGNGTLWGLPFLLVAAVFLVRAVVRDERLAPAQLPQAVLGSAVLGLVRAPGLELQPTSARWPYLLVTLGMAAIALTARRRGARAFMLPSLLALFALSGALVLGDSPAPRIDVFQLEQAGARALLDGHNPYAIAYPNPYDADETRRFFGDQRATLDAYPYPPLSLFATLPGRLAGDVRWSFLALELLLALAAYAFARRSGHPREHALAACALVLLHPRALFVLEQGWTEPLPAAALAWALALPGVALSGLCLGAFLAAKQYSVIALPLFLRDGLRQSAARRALGLALFAAALVTLPLALAQPRAFIDDVIGFQLRQPFRADALSLPALAALVTGLRAPGLLAPVAAAAALAWSWRRTGRVRALALAYFAFFACAKQAFCNYYWLAGALLLLAAFEAPRAETAGAAAAFAGDGRASP